MRGRLFFAFSFILAAASSAHAQVATGSEWVLRSDEPRPAFNPLAAQLPDSIGSVRPVAVISEQQNYRWEGTLAGLGIGVVWSGFDYWLCSNSEERHNGCSGPALRHGAVVGVVFAIVGHFVGWSIAKR